MTATTLDAGAPATPAAGKLGWPATIALHLFPGAAMAAVYVVLAPMGMAAGLPPLFTLAICAILVLAPLELGHLLIIGRRATGRWTLRGAVAAPPRIQARKFVAVVAAAFVATIVLYAASRPADLWFAAHISRFLPRWLDYSDLGAYRHLAPAALGATLVARFVADILIVPATEELYFRGYLMSRIPVPAWLAPLVSAALFAVYHAWQPYNWPSIFCFSLPMIVAVAWFKDVRLSITVHILLNLLGFVVFAAALLHR
jgi:membrane protease YdiL (CAAX protease family)